MLILVEAGNVPGAQANAGSMTSGGHSPYSTGLGRVELPVPRCTSVVVAVYGTSVLILAPVQKCFILKQSWKLLLDLCTFHAFTGRKDKVEHPARMLV